MNELTPTRKFELIHKIAEKVVDLKLTPMAIVLLESVKPFSFVASQLLVFFQPIYAAVFPTRPYDELVQLFEDRASIELLICEIEKIEEETSVKKKNTTIKNS
ncbi:MAG: hypothetical protein NZ601_05250 [candidate division WOR-3 bacterium]|nr:hypothetical protein [candidate division WOR-3 bacterium]MDW7987490.1 hypothetical protein [candidate division WOR-3 bacterium]